MSATNTVQVKYRHVEIAAAAPFADCGDGTHRLTLDAPPPVRTVLSIAGGGGTRTYVVAAVVEVPGEGTPRGCVVREVPSDRLPSKVGTERLRDGALGSAAPSAGADARPADGAADDEAYGTHMAVPAPVISEDSSEPTDVGDGDADDGAASGDASDDGASTPDGSEGGGSTRAKKRRGRQRK